MILNPKTDLENRINVPRERIENPKTNSAETEMPTKHPSSPDLRQEMIWQELINQRFHDGNQQENV
jgi:hypothetical protein